MSDRCRLDLRVDKDTTFRGALRSGAARQDVSAVEPLVLLLYVSATEPAWGRLVSS